MSIELGLTMGSDGSLLETGSVASRGKAGAAGASQGGLSGFLALLAQFDTAAAGDPAASLGGKDAGGKEPALASDTPADAATTASDATLTLTDPASLIAQMQTALAGQDPAAQAALPLPPAVPVPPTAAPVSSGAVAAQDVVGLLAGAKAGKAGAGGAPGLAGAGRAGMAPLSKAGSAQSAAQSAAQARDAAVQPSALAAGMAGAAAGQAGGQGNSPLLASGDGQTTAADPLLAGQDTSPLAVPADATTAKADGQPTSVQDVVARLSQNLANRPLQPAAPADLAQAGGKSQLKALGVGAAEGDAPAQALGKPGRSSDKHGSVGGSSGGSVLDAVLRTDRAAEGAAGTPALASSADSFRQLVAAAKGDKPAEATPGSTPAAGVADRAPTLPSGVWDASAHAARAVGDTASTGASAAMPAAAYASTEQQVADQVSMWVTQNVQSAELKLDALGKDPVEVSISLSGNEAQVQFRSDHAETRDLLTRAAADLDKSLQREGLVLSNVSVAMSNQGQQGQARDQAQNTAAQPAGKAWQRGGSGDPVAQGVSLSASVRPSRGAVDLFV